MQKEISSDAIESPTEEMPNLVPVEGGILVDSNCSEMAGLETMESPTNDVAQLPKGKVSSLIAQIEERESLAKETKLTNNLKSTMLRDDFNATADDCKQVQDDDAADAPLRFVQVSNTLEVVLHEKSKLSENQNVVLYEAGCNSSSDFGTAGAAKAVANDPRSAIYRTKDIEISLETPSLSPVVRDPTPLTMVPSTLFSVGMNDDGQLGISQSRYPCASRFRRVSLKQKGETPQQFVDIICGSMWVIAIDMNRTAWSWGFDECIGRQGVEFTPSIIPQLRGRKIALVACGEYITVFLDSLGTIWACGGFRTQKGAYFLTESIPKSKRLVVIPGPESIVQLTSGESHIAFLDNTGNSYTWGSGENGQLGRESSAEKDMVVTKVQFPKDVKIFSVWAVGFHTFWATSKGLYGCGNNGYGELGLGHVNVTCAPTPIYFPNEIVQVSGGMHHVLFLDTLGKVWATGRNQCGQCGFDPPNFLPVNLPLPPIKIIKAGKSSNHSC